MNWSNGAVASSRHPPSGVISARAEDGSAQYGWRSHSPRLSTPKNEWVYQMKPMTVVSATAPTEISSRVRNSRTWSTSDMVPSGLTRLRRWRGSRRDRNLGVRTVFYLAAPERRCVLAGSGRAGVGRVGRRSIDPLGVKGRRCRGGLRGRRLRNDRGGGLLLGL